MTRTVAEVNRAWAEVFEDAYTLVPGEGDTRAALALVGEAPGAQEEALRRPFVGTAGKNLDAFLQGVDLRREALYITNAVKFRPTRQGKSARLSNCTPTRQEAALFRPWLMEELQAVGPRIVATLGNTALRAVAGGTQVIGEVHGTLMAIDAPYLLFPLYHPASIIYRRELAEVYAEDVKKLRDVMRSL